MKQTTKNILDELIERYPVLESCGREIEDAFILLEKCYNDNKKILVCGNGGSASDSEHIVGELLKSFKKKREIPLIIKENLLSFGEQGKFLTENLEGAIPCVSLTSHVAFSTAFLNDKEPLLTFAQQLMGIGQKGDVLITLSTSGNSKNCVYASIVAKAMGIKVIALTGNNQSKLGDFADVVIKAPETETYKVQELHLPIYHCICAMLEEENFKR